MAQHGTTEVVPSRSAARVVLRRDRGDNPFGGVAAGLANYLGIDVVIVRAIFVVLAVAGVGSGWILYLALYFLMPREQDGDVVRFPPGSCGQRTARLVAGTALVALGTGFLAFQLVPNLRWETALAAAVIVIGLLVVVFGALRR